MCDVFICDGICMLIGCYGGVLVSVCVDDLVVILLCEFLSCNFGFDLVVIDDVIFGCVNQVGEDNCNVVYMVMLLVGYLYIVLGIMINCLCGLGLDVIGFVVRVIKVGDVDLLIVGGVELMLCVFFVMGKVSVLYQCQVEFFDIMIGWCFVNLFMV